LNDPNAMGLTQSGVLADGLPAEAFAKAGMAEMSEKFKAMGEQVYVDAERVKESNRVL
jgi:phosphomethylpyrimidine synthase